MENGRVQSHKGVTLVGAGHPSAESIDEALKLAPTLVAADGGADFALEVGLKSTAVIGDLDSLSEATKEVLDPAQIIAVPEQETTDFEKCLSRLDAPFVLAVGFSAGRLDHTFDAMSVIARGVGPPTILVGNTDVAFAVPDEIQLDLEPETRLSLCPMNRVTGRSEGLFWPIDGIEFGPIGKTGTSNRATGRVALSFDGPGMIAILPPEALGRVLPALVD